MMETCTRMALGDGAINGAKDEVEGALETRKLIWGLTTTKTGEGVLPASPSGV